MPPPPIRGILFDKDGTLFDFQATWGRVIEAALDVVAADRESRVRMAHAGGYDPERRRFAPGSAFVAGSNGEIAALWASFRPDLGAVEIERTMEAVARRALADPAALVPAVADLPGLLARLRGRGYALGVATNDSEQGARFQLQAAGALDAFDFVAGYDSGHGAKPGPGMLLGFAAAAGIEPGALAMVGDSRHDFECARAGGAGLAIGVLTGPALREDLAPAADHVLPSIADLPAFLDAWVR